MDGLNLVYSNIDVGRGEFSLAEKYYLEMCAQNGGDGNSYLPKKKMAKRDSISISVSMDMMKVFSRRLKSRQESREKYRRHT
jgi:hypothetical protein